MDKLNLIIADDHTLIRAGLKNVIAQIKNAEIVGEFDNGLDALHFIIDNEPELAILDIDMPKMDGFEVCEKVREEKIKTKIIFLTMLNEREVYNRALLIGANGFILKNFAMDEMNNAIQTVLKNNFYISNDLQNNLVNKPNKLIQNEKINELISKLTSTEKQILKLISKNIDSKQIAEKLFCSELTIRKHRQNISKKLNLIKKTHSLSKFAIENRDYLI